MAFGIGEIDKGHVKAYGQEIESASQAVGLGIGYVSKNRDTEAIMLGIFLDELLKNNYHKDHKNHESYHMEQSFFFFGYLTTYYHFNK